MALLAAVCHVAVAKDLTLVQRYTGIAPNQESHEVTQYWTDAKTINDDARVRTIADLDAKTLTIVDKQRKTYAVTTFDQLRQQADAMKSRMPAEGKNAEDVQVTLTPTGNTETIAGYAAKEYAIAGGPFSGAVWVSEALQPPQGTRAFEKIGALVGGGHNPASKLAEAMTKLNGIPLRMSVKTKMGEGAMTIKTEVIAVRETPPPPEVLAIPDGYTKVEAPAPRPRAPGPKSRR